MHQPDQSASKELLRPRHVVTHAPTLVTAESLPQAQFLVRHLYGKGALVSLVRVH